MNFVLGLSPRASVTFCLVSAIAGAVVVSSIEGCTLGPSASPDEGSAGTLGTEPADPAARPASTSATPVATASACLDQLNNAGWSDVYASVFAPNTPGHCGKCHGATPNGGLLVGTTKDSFLAGLVAKGLVDPSNPSKSLILDPSSSPVRWFSDGGPMPRDAAQPNADAAARVSAWLSSAKPASCKGGGSGVANPPPVSTCDAASLDSPAWTKIYDAYFAPGTAGHCGNCHGSTPNGGLLVGSTSQSFLQGLVNRGLIDPANPKGSLLLDPNASPVHWFNPAGPMPRDAAVANPQAAADVTAWVTSLTPIPCGAPPASPPAAPADDKGTAAEADTGGAAAPADPGGAARAGAKGKPTK
jgi:hypothetical protein